MLGICSIIRPLSLKLGCSAKSNGSFYVRKEAATAHTHSANTIWPIATKIEKIFLTVCVWFCCSTPENMWRRDTQNFESLTIFSRSLSFAPIVHQSFAVDVFQNANVWDGHTRSMKIAPKQDRGAQPKWKKGETMREKKIIWLHHKNRKCARHQAHASRFDLNEPKRVSVCMFQYVHVNFCDWRDDHFALMKRRKKNIFFISFGIFFQFTTWGSLLEEGIGSNAFHWFTILKKFITSSMHINQHNFLSFLHHFQWIISKLQENF